MFYRTILRFIEGSWIEGNQSRYALWKISQKKNESDVLKKYTPKTGKQKITRDKKERRD
jgi:hypothetical protein